MNKQYTSIEVKMQDDYDAIAPAFAESRADLNWPELDEMVEQIKPGQKILDIGCGTGRLCGLLRKSRIDYTGIDISAEQIRKAAQNYPAQRFIQCAMADLPFETGVFDAVFMIASLQHLLTKEQRLRALTQARRVLSRRGRLFITVKAFWQLKFLSLFFNQAEGMKQLSPELQKSLGWRDLFWPWRWKTPSPVYRYYHAFTKRELKTLLHKAGFRVERVNYVDKGKPVRWYRGKNIAVRAVKVV